MRLFLFEISWREELIYQENVPKGLFHKNAYFSGIVKFTENTTFHYPFLGTSGIVEL
jgi:hypothetical protein